MDIHLADDCQFEILTAIKLMLPISYYRAYDQYALNGFQLNDDIY